ncbi:HdeD family acid-resistance protein [Prolixibacter denitrificans]|uniref:Membrane protein n=1 Tax=Prolixibacter denitrificans TaxID=1541063 RepID=A0A2P8CG55_9BACT|nr:DUF308 domain-containing protein [Prolixibacter denitrificans]PSK83975.1 uncharacterized membrane protein HdeD (DUF308 family) [Prolixibacter denitrificans]GET23517.1 membrane protein [Prolixibacter denitrificans]
MQNRMFTSYRGALVRGVIAVIAGGLAVFVPNITLQSIVVYIGLLILLGGLVSLLFALRSKNPSGRNMLMTQAVFNLIIGILFVALPATMVKIFVIVLGIGFLFIGIFQLMGALNARHEYGWSWIYFIISVLVIIAGGVMLANPFSSAETILTFIGVLLLIYGLAELYMSWKLSRQPKTYHGKEVTDTHFEEL